MQLDGQLCLLPACQALTADPEDQFDSLIKDFHFAFVNMTEAVSQRHNNEQQCKRMTLGQSLLSQRFTGTSTSQILIQKVKH